MTAAPLSPATVEAVLDRFGFPSAPEPDRGGLETLYLAWCRNVPFDNLVKRIHMAAGDPSPLPNGEPEDFFDWWLRHGTGGTCWPTAAGLHALLTAVGFDARRGSAAMRDDLVGPVHSHGTMLVHIGGEAFWTDPSMLSNKPLPLRVGEETRLDEPVHPLRAEPAGGLWRVWWETPPLPEPIGCLLLDADATHDHYLARYEASREVSPFNSAVYARRNHELGVVVAALGQRFEKTAEGTDGGAPPGGITTTLVEELGFSEEIVARLPPDDPLPPPPRANRRPRRWGRFRPTS